MQRVEPEADERIDEAAIGQPRRDLPDQQRDERDARAGRVRERPAERRSRSSAPVTATNASPATPASMNDCLVSTAAAANTPAAKTSRASRRRWARTRHRTEMRRRHRRKQLRRREDCVDRHRSGQQRSEQPGDPARTLPCYRPAQRRDGDDERDGGQRAQYPHAMVAAQHGDLEQPDQERRPIEPVRAVQRAVARRPVARDVGDAALVPAERRGEVRRAQEQREQHATAERARSP